MTKNILTLGGIFILLSMYSCSSDDEICPDTKQAKQEGNILLQEKGKTIPAVKTLPLSVFKSGNTRSIGPNGEIIGNSDALLGYSYSIGNSIMGDMENVKFPVLDLEKIKSMGNTYITRKQLNSSSSYAFSYNGMSRYEANSQVSKTVKKGFSLNLGLFKIGRQKKTTELFKSSFSYGANVVYGELNLEVRNSQFELLTTDDKRKIYARQCLTPTFLTDLYRGTIGNLLAVYGPFVLRSYITGGKAMALYAGNNKKSSSSQLKEQGLTEDINASFSWKSNSVSGDLSFGRTNGSSSSSEYTTTDLEIYIQTFGGNPAFQAIIGPQKLDAISVDLSPWLNSLSNNNSHTIIDITPGAEDDEGGLYPMSDFVLEKNFQYRMDDTTLGTLESYNEVQDPKFEIVKVLARTTSSGEKLYEVAAVLNTRQGDKIVLSDGAYKTASDASLRENNNNQTMMSKVQSIFAQKKNIFKDLEFSTNYSKTYNPDVRIPLCIRLDGFKENAMSLYVDPKTNMHYIFNSTNKIALSYLDDEEYGDYVLDYYGIRDWVESLPKKNISMMILQGFTIIGL